MKIKLANQRRPAGYILILVLVLTAISLLIVVGDIYRTSTVSNLNLRSNQLSVLDNAAEAATEKVYAIMARDFSAYGPGQVSNSIASYQTNYPNYSDNPYWTNFNFTDPSKGTAGTYVAFVTNYTGQMPTQYSNDYAFTSPVYRIISNVTMPNSLANVVGTAQEDVMLALVPITTYAIFYNGDLEFSDCATMVVAGRTHSNANVCTGAGSGDTCTFNGAVTCSGVIWSPERGGIKYSLNQGTSFPAGKATNVDSVQISIPMTNTHAIIDVPPAGELTTSILGQEREYNIAQVVLLITNSATTTNVVVHLQTSYNDAVPGADPAMLQRVVTNATPDNLLTNSAIQLPFLSLTNSFYDQRQDQTNVVAQIDVGAYAAWCKTNSTLLGKVSPANGDYPTVLYVADLRNIPNKMSVVRLVNAQKLPPNTTSKGLNLGFTVGTKNPLYVEGDYNTTLDGTHFSLDLGATTNGYTVPAALLSDALTILSTNWDDSKSAGKYTSLKPPSSPLTLNAAIITGNVPTTGTSATTFSGGVHNLTRFLENWGGVNVIYNTSIVCLFQSTMATKQFLMPYSSSNPNGYYYPPKRLWGFDPTYYDPNKQPPGVPCALVPIRSNWAVPAPGKVN